jgi:hypothetical protein
MKAMIATSIGFKSQAYRHALIAVAGLGMAILMASQAGAVTAQVRNACAGDYLSNCSQFEPESSQTRRCMRAVGYKLSKGCIDALVAAGEVSKADIARRSASIPH